MRKPFILLPAAALLALSVAATAFGVADIYRNEAATLVEGWDWSEDKGPPAWAWEQVERYLWLASRLAPFDAQIKSDLGQLHELRADDSSNDFDTALGYYRQSLALRPAWPQAWADLALLKITQDRIDAEFALALQRALTLGPWQSDVQASIAGGGFTVWDQLPATLQTDVEQTVARGLSNRSRLMPLVARRFDLLEIRETKPVNTVSSNSAPEG